MSDFYDKFFAAEGNAPEPPADLNKKIIKRVEAAKRRVIILKTIGFGALLAGSFSALIVAYFNFTAAISQSGFTSFISLFFSDFSSAMANFQDFAFSIIESFPVFSAAFVVGGLIAVIWSAANFIDDLAIIRSQKYIAIG